MLSLEHAMTRQFFFLAIVSMPVGWPNIDNVTCLLTPPMAQRGSQYQAIDDHCEEAEETAKHPIATTITNFIIIIFIFPLANDAKKWKILAEIIIHKCNRDHPKSRPHIFYPHNVRQWSGELESLELCLE
jgi:hypothetical protein